MSQEPSYYAVIPASIRYDKSLPAAAKLLYGEITALSSKEGYCYAGNAYFAELYDVSKDTVSVWINKLDKAGHLRVEIDKKAGNVRRIYLSDKNTIPIAKKQDRYREKSLEVSRKNGIAIEKNREHNTTSNNTSSITNSIVDVVDAHTQEFRTLEDVTPLMDAAFEQASDYDKRHKWGAAIAPPVAPAPPSDVDPVSVADPYTVYQAGYLSDRQLMETSQMVLKIPEGKVIEFLALFTAEQRGFQKLPADITEFKKHAYAWIRIQAEKSARHGKPKNTATIPSGPKIPVPVSSTTANPTGTAGAGMARSGFNRRVTS